MCFTVLKLKRVEKLKRLICHAQLILCDFVEQGPPPESSQPGAAHLWQCGNVAFGPPGESFYIGKTYIGAKWRRMPQLK